MSTLNIEMSQPLCPPSANVCRRTLNQFARIRLPITVVPCVTTGAISTRCSGPPILAPSTSFCGDSSNQSCSYTLIQNIRISIPVKFGARVQTGTPGVQCGLPTVSNNADLADANAEEENIEAVYSEIDDVTKDSPISIPGTSHLMDKGL